MPSFSKAFLTVACIAAASSLSRACDACALFVPPAENHHGFTLGPAYQFTRMGTVWNGHNRQPNPVDQHVNSSITQLTLGYTRAGPWQVQLTLPYIVRSYLRPEHALIERGRVSGIGDVTLAGRFLAFNRALGENTLTFAVLGGIEFGTGNADHLGDEVGAHFHHHANFADSGVHGHDLALGSGSTDYLLGFDCGWQRGRGFARASLQYKLRRPGAFGYRLADETSGETGTGWYAIMDEQKTLSAQALFSFEHKGLDVLTGVPQVDTGFSGRYVGARFAGTFGRRFNGDASIELPVRLRTSELMVVPDYRIRASFTWRY